MNSNFSLDHTQEIEPLVITVGVVSYNRPDLLNRALESVVSQTYSHLEILVSDNGSTDPRVSELIKNFAASDNRIRAIFHPLNQGPFFNFRAVLNEAKGNYFVWLADDDYWCPEFLESILAQAIQTGAALTYGRAEIVDIDVVEAERIGKEMFTETGCFASMFNFAQFDTDSVFYGLFPTVIGKKLAGALQNWWIPKALAEEYPFLEYNFVSYVFIFGLLSSGGFCNASSDKTVHYAGGREPFSPSPNLGYRHILLFLAYVLIHFQMAARFAKATLLAGSLQGVLVSPFAALYLFLKRICMIVFMRFNTLIKG